MRARVRHLPLLAARRAREHALVAAVMAVSLAAGIAVSIASYLLQAHFAQAYRLGHHLNGVENFLRLGAPWQSLVPVAAAALIAAWASLRIGGASPEPPLSLGRGDGGSAHALRQALRSERHLVRIAFLVVSGLVGVVLVRFLAYSLLTLAGERLARGTWDGVALELLFWLAAWGAFWNWNRCHRQRMAAWGVQDG
ncbi:MAG: hypothetical protein ACREOL_00600 [Candidatus Dormibacteria bacterium]